MRGPSVVRSELARLEPVGRVVIAYLFIRFAKCTLEMRRSISFVIISAYRRLLTILFNNAVTIYAVLNSGSSHSLWLPLQKGRAGFTEQFPETAKARGKPPVTGNCTAVMGEDPAMRTARGSYTPPVHGVKAERSRAEDALEHAS